VTIAITTYQRARLVARAIDSALGQTYPLVEVVVVDDGSTDDTERVLERYAGEPRLRVVRHPVNRGANAAKNSGVTSVPDDVPYFMLLDSDDILRPRAAELLVPVLDDDADGRLSMAMGWAKILGSDEDKGRVTHLPDRTGLVTYEDALLGRYAGDFQFLCRRDAVGPMRFEERARGTTATMWWRVLQDRPGWLIPDVVKDMDMSGTDHMSVPTFSARSNAGMMWGRQVYLEEYGADLRRLDRHTHGRAQAELAKWAALAGDGPRARRAARSALVDAPSPRSLMMVALSMIPSRLALWAGRRWARIRVRLGR
jgi:glycosyltransferase involved in cell wall biosynthesis